MARGIQALGVEFGDDFKRASRKNPTGFFEDRELLALSKRVRRAVGLRADSVRLVDPADWRRQEVQHLQRQAVALIRRRFAHVPVWGFKYGRTLRLIPFWEEVFAAVPVEPAYVFALRDPLSVAKSRARLDARRGTQEKSDLESLAGIVPYLARLRGLPTVVVDYDLLVQQPEAQLRRIAARLRLPVDARIDEAIRQYCISFIDPAMQRNRSTREQIERDGRLSPLARDVYFWLRELAEDSAHWDDAGLWERWRRIEDAFAVLSPALAHIDRVEGEYRHAARNPLAFIPYLGRRWRAYRQS
jgi:hypothetical protein